MKTYQFYSYLFALRVFLFPLASPLFVFAESNAVQQNCQQKLTLDAFRGFALNNSPMISEIDASYALELAKAFESEVLINPELQLEQTFTRMKLGGDDDSQSQISLSQPVRISNFGSRARVAAVIRKAGETKKQAALLEFSQKLVVQFKALFVLQKNEEIIIDAETRAAKNVSLVKTGVKKGLFSAGEEKLFEGEMYRLKALRNGVASARAIHQQELANSAGLLCSISVVDQLINSALPNRELVMEKANKSMISQIARQDLLVNLLAEQTRLSELDAYPQIAPRLVYQHTNDGGDFYGAGISIALPFWNRNQGERMRTSAESIAQRRKQAFMRDGGFDAQVTSLWNAASNLTEQAGIFHEKVVPAFTQALDAQERLYAKGKGNIIQVWQTLRALNDAQFQSLTYWVEAASARAQLSIIIGEEI